MKLVEQLDESADRAFDGLRGNAAADRAFWVASELADMSMGWHLINAVLTLIWPSRLRFALRLAVALGIESALVNGAIKPMFNRQRPPARTDTELLTRRPNTSSFPSGHASSAATAATLLSNEFPRARLLWWGVGAFVGLSRVHNSQHHASDVAAGFVTGRLIGAGFLRWWPLSPTARVAAA